MYFYSYWLFQLVNLTNIQHFSVKFNVPPVQQLPHGKWWWWKRLYEFPYSHKQVVEGDFRLHYT